MAKRLLGVDAGVAVLEHLAARLVRGSASIAGQRRLESLPIHGFVSDEIPTGRGVAQGFSVAKTDPPALSSGVHTFGARRLHGRTGGIDDIVLNESDDDRPSTPQGVRVDVQLVLGEAARAGALDGVSDGDTGTHSEYGAGDG